MRMTIATSVALLVVSSVSGAQATCDDKAVYTAIEWIQDNNVDAFSKFEKGCSALTGSIESGLGLTLIVDGYKEGQSHAPSVAKLIDTCSAIQLLDICGRAFPSKKPSG